MILGNEYILGINIVCLIVIIFNLYEGYKNGILAKLFSLLSFFLLSFIAYQMAPIVAKLYSFVKYAPESMRQYLQISGFMQYVDQVLWFFILLFVFRIIAKILLHTLKRLHKIPVYHLFSASLGAILGFLEGIIICIFIAMFLQSGLFVNGKQIMQKTILSPINNYAEDIMFKTFQLPWLQKLNINQKQLPSFIPKEKNYEK